MDIQLPPAGELRDCFITLRSAAHGSDDKTPVLWILDPFDYSSASFGLVRACLASPRDEVLITWFGDVHAGAFSIAGKNETARYALVFATHSDAGMECYNGTKWRMDPSHSHHVSETRSMGQADLSAIRRSPRSCAPAWKRRPGSR